jgi:hypothetical protein
MLARRVLLALSLALSWAGPTPARADGVPAAAAPAPAAEPPEPPPAPLEEPEPDPAPLFVEKTAAERAAEAAALAERERQAQARATALRAYTGLGWTGAALTLSLVVTGVSFGVLAQSRSDALSRLSTQSSDGFPPIYDPSQHAEWLRLQDEGPQFSRGAIGTLISAGVLAVGTGVLFWARERRFGKDLTAAAPTWQLRPSGSGLALLGRF